ncbi:MAG: cytochrome c3 family protein [Actinomycetota bacterium]|nr:cytochrome c3 family protein [Actinomycetota bacterium]
MGEEKEKGRSIWRDLTRRQWLILGTIAFLLVVLIVLLWFLLRERPRIVKPFRAYQCLACHRLEKGKYVHSPYGNVYCTSCHTPHKLGEKSKLVVPLKELCLSCHPGIGKQLNLSFVHDPVGKGNCLDCHEPHVADYQYLLKKSSKDLCVACHRFVKEFTMADTHLPFLNRQCLSCHVAHGSEEDHGLIKGQKILCIICHREVGRVIQRPYPHDPVDGGRCTDCHGPHATDFARQLYAPKTEFCFLCHREISPYFDKISHHPLNEDFYCADCHDPHAGLYRYLLPEEGNVFCYLCHEAIGRTYPDCAHNFVSWTKGKGLCLNCHEVHGSDYPPLLVNESVALCKSCHLTVPHDRVDHPYGPLFIDELKGTTLTCTSTCHDPHGTGLLAMLTSLPDGLCLRCHPASELP